MQRIYGPPAFQRPNGKLYLSAQQDDIANTTWTLVNLNTIHADFNDAIENVGTHKIRPGIAGFYAIFGQAVFNHIIANKKYQVAVWRTGGGTILSNQHASFVDFLYVSCSDIMYLDENDDVELRVYHNAGVGSIDVSTGTGKDTRLTIQRVR